MHASAFDSSTPAPAHQTALYSSHLLYLPVSPPSLSPSSLHHSTAVTNKNAHSSQPPALAIPLLEKEAGAFCYCGLTPPLS